jgi:phosphohistidine phosphatase SixA
LGTEKTVAEGLTRKPGHRNNHMRIRTTPLLTSPIGWIRFMMSRNVKHRLVAAIALTIVLFGPSGARADEAIWRSLQEGGHAILIRHALAPGTGDPAGFSLEACATQRNLSAEGRAQARRIGATLKARKVPINRILSSRWCRALETAHLMDLGPVEPFPLLDSFFSTPALGPEQTAAMKAFLQGLGEQTIVIVSHQVNITALTGIFPRSGEMIVAKPGADASDSLVVVGRIAQD